MSALCLVYFALFVIVSAHVFLELVSIQIITASPNTGFLRRFKWFKELVLLSPWIIEDEIEDEVEPESPHTETTGHEVPAKEAEGPQDPFQGRRRTYSAYEEDVRFLQALYFALRSSNPSLPPWWTRQNKKTRELGVIRLVCIALECGLVVVSWGLIST